MQKVLLSKVNKLSMKDLDTESDKTCFLSSALLHFIFIIFYESIMYFLKEKKKMFNPQALIKDTISINALFSFYLFSFFIFLF